MPVPGEWWWSIRAPARPKMALGGAATCASGKLQVAARPGKWRRGGSVEVVTTRVFGEAKNMNFLKNFLQYVKHVNVRSNTSQTR